MIEGGENSITGGDTDHALGLQESVHPGRQERQETSGRPPSKGDGKDGSSYKPSLKAKSGPCLLSTTRRAQETGPGLVSLGRRLAPLRVAYRRTGSLPGCRPRCGRSPGSGRPPGSPAGGRGWRRCHRPGYPVPAGCARPRGLLAPWHS